MDEVISANKSLQNAAKFLVLFLTLPKYEMEVQSKIIASLRFNNDNV